VDLAFALISGSVLTGTATAIYLGQIPPGGRWFFRAQFVDYDGQIFKHMTAAPTKVVAVHGLIQF